MSSAIIKYVHLILVLMLVAGQTVQAGDLDDEIKIDEKIEKYDTLDRPGINIQYIKRSAKASVADSDKTSTGNGDVAIGSFINKPGAKVGDVTIIFDGEDINAISE